MSNFVEANAKNISAKFQLYAPCGFWADDFLFFFTNWALQLLWQPIKLRGLDKIDKFGRVLLKEHFCKTFIKISAVR